MDDNSKWLTKKPLYRATHFWVARNFGKAKTCELAETTCTKKSKTYHWANISGDYIRERSDWKELCASCHKKMDYTQYAKDRTSELKKGNKYAKRVPVVAIDKSGITYKTYDSIADASRDLGILITSISNCICGYSKTAGGYKWQAQ